MTVFDVMDLTPYTFLQIQRGGITGNTIVLTQEATGVFKLRSNFVRGENAETKESSATLHVKPEETFLAEFSNSLIGHGILVFDKQYEVVGQTGGMNYHDGVMEHYTLTLQESEFVTEES
jgi:hypothetical protein